MVRQWLITERENQENRKGIATQGGAFNKTNTSKSKDCWQIPVARLPMSCTPITQSRTSTALGWLLIEPSCLLGKELAGEDANSLGKEFNSTSYSESFKVCFQLSDKPCILLETAVLQFNSRNKLVVYQSDRKRSSLKQQLFSRPKT